MTPDYVAELERASNAWIEELDHDPFVGPIIRGDASVEEYVAFLCTTYHYVRWSGPLLARTAEGLRRRGHHRRLTALSETKSSEESTHDRWLLADLKACGGAPELFPGATIPSAIRAYVEWGLALAEQGSPGYLGAAYTLEFASMRRAKIAADNLCARQAIPEINRAVSFLTGHGDADAEHVAILADVLRAIDDPREQGDVILTGAVTRFLYPRFFSSTSAPSRISIDRRDLSELFLTAANDNAGLPSVPVNR